MRPPSRRLSGCNRADDMPFDLAEAHQKRRRGVLASLQDYEDWRRETPEFASMGAYAVRRGNLGGGTEPVKIQHALVTPSLLTTIGVVPAAGRLFAAQKRTRPARMPLPSSA